MGSFLAPLGMAGSAPNAAGLVRDLQAEGLQFSVSNGVLKMRGHDQAVVEKHIQEVAAHLDDITPYVASQSMFDYVNFIKPKHDWSWHHQVICFYLDKLLRGEIRFLMIFAPPRHGKSEIVSRLFPTYTIGRNPDWQIISCSYGATLARKMNKNCQGIMNTPAYLSVFPHAVLPNRRDRTGRTCNENEWQLADPASDGYYCCAGVDGPIVGMGADVGIIDDPFKNRKQADSPTYLKSVEDWYDEAFRTRLMAGGRILLMHQRWGPNDLAGLLLDRMKSYLKADQWAVLCLPAVYEEGEFACPEDPRQPGEALWPTKYPLSELEPHMRKIESWSSLYQQRPIASHTQMFKSEKWREESLPPPDEIVLRVRFWDTSGTEKGDPYSGTLLAMDVRGKCYIEDCVTFQADPGKAEERMKEVAQDDTPEVLIASEEEKGGSGKQAIAALRRALPGYVFIGVPVSGSKVTRAKPYAAAQAHGRVVLVKGKDWHDFKKEHASFPRASHDDRVDSSSGAYAVATTQVFDVMFEKKNIILDGPPMAETSQAAQKILELKRAGMTRLCRVWTEDRTAHLLVGQAKDRSCHVLEYQQGNYDETDILEYAKNDGLRCLVALYQQQGASGKAENEQLLRKLSVGRKVHALPFPSDDARMALARPLAAHTRAKRFSIENRKEWGPLVKQCFSWYPLTRYNGIVDAIALGFDALDNTTDPLASLAALSSLRGGGTSTTSVR